MHHLRRLRIPVPGRHRASSHHHRPAPRRRQHRRLGRRPTAPSSSSRSKSNGNALGLSALERDKFIAEAAAFPIFDGTQEYCLWLGCMGGYDPKGREIIADFARSHDITSAPASASCRRKNAPATPPAASATTSSSSSSPNEPRSHRSSKRSRRSSPSAPTASAPSQDRLARVRHRPRDRAPQRIHGPPRRPNCPTTSPPTRTRPKRSSTTTPATSAATSDVYDEPRTVVAIRRHPRRSRTPPRTQLLLRRRRRPRLPRRRNRHSASAHVRAAELVATGATTIGTACPFCNTMFRDALGSDRPIRPATARHRSDRRRPTALEDCAVLINGAGCPHISLLRCGPDSPGAPHLAGSPVSGAPHLASEMWA